MDKNWENLGDVNISMQSWSQNGYGFPGDFLDNLSVETKIEFTKRHLPDVYEECKEDFESMDDWEEFFESGFREQVNSDSVGFGNILAEVLRTKEDLSVDYCTGVNSYATLILNETLPWLMSPKMKSLTKEEFEEIVNKYIEELKDLEKQDLSVNFDYETIEYYGYSE